MWLLFSPFVSCCKKICMYIYSCKQLTAIFHEFSIFSLGWSWGTKNQNQKKGIRILTWQISKLFLQEKYLPLPEYTPTWSNQPIPKTPIPSRLPAGFLQKLVRKMDCICSLAHHDAKLRKRNPDYPMLTDAERRRNPPRRVPLSLKHPETGKRAIYGINSSTCFVIAQNQVPGLRGWEFSICFDLDRVGLVSGRKNVLVFVLFEKSSIHVNLSNIFFECVMILLHNVI